MTLFDEKETYDIDPQILIIEYLQKFEISDKFMNFIKDGKQESRIKSQGTKPMRT